LTVFTGSICFGLVGSFLIGMRGGQFASSFPLISGSNELLLSEFIDRQRGVIENIGGAF
jgi:hypothetical protein